LVRILPIFAQGIGDGAFFPEKLNGENNTETTKKFLTKGVNNGN